MHKEKETVGFSDLIEPTVSHPSIQGSIMAEEEMERWYYPWARDD